MSLIGAWTWIGLVMAGIPCLKYSVLYLTDSSEWTPFLTYMILDQDGDDLKMKLECGIDGIGIH